LYSLCVNFPEDAARYLDKMDGVQGFQDKNVRQLWLVLAIVASKYKLSEKESFKEELRGYTSKKYSFEIRQKAFQYIHQLELYNESVVNNLVNAAVHHNWRFRNASRELLDEVLQNSDTKERLKREYNSFSISERKYLTRVIEVQ